jgi:hypothetical protein
MLHLLEVDDAKNQQSSQEMRDMELSDGIYQESLNG